MGLFSSKVAIAELRIGLFPNKKASISIIELNKDKSPVVRSKLPFILYMFYFDRVLYCLPENIASGTLNAVHELATKFINKCGQLMQLWESTDPGQVYSPEKWENAKPEFKTPNEWNFTTSEPDFESADFKVKATMFKKGDHLYCQTEFSRSPLLEASLFLTVEAVLSYMPQSSEFDDYAFYFLPGLLAQCSSYQGKPPGVTELGQAVRCGWMYAEKLSAEREQRDTELLRQAEKLISKAQYNHSDVPSEFDPKIRSIIESNGKNISPIMWSNIMSDDGIASDFKSFSKTMKHAVHDIVVEQSRIFRNNFPEASPAAEDDLRRDIGGYVMAGYVIGRHLLGTEAHNLAPGTDNPFVESTRALLINRKGIPADLIFKGGDGITDFLNFYVDDYLKRGVFARVADREKAAEYIFLPILNGFSLAITEYKLTR